ncbi:MAG: IscS subfamily cysteine desulfurase [Rhodospirillales bacterium]
MKSVPAAWEGLRTEPKMPVYLDYQATTPTDPRVVAAMLPYFTQAFGNPHSRSHGYGLAAEDAVERARRQIAGLIAADAREIVFTSGATEANNLAIKGAARFAALHYPVGDGQSPPRRRIITPVTEHKCVIESCRALADEGFDIVWLPVQPSGLIHLDQLAAALDDTTLLVSVMAVNNEIGVVQPLAEIGRLARAHGALFHTDAAQAAGKIPLDVTAMNLDLVSVSAHKMYGPKGIGALYVRRRPRVRLAPLLSGGGQERGLRSGTLPTPLIAGFGEACRIAGEEMTEEMARLARLRDRLRQGLAERLPSVYLNGDADRRIAGNLNFAFEGVDGEELLTALDDVAVSSGSACSSASVEPSYVIRALGRDRSLAEASIRIGLGRFTTPAEIDYAVARIASEVERIRAGKPRSTRLAGADLRAIEDDRR